MQRPAVLASPNFIDFLKIFLGALCFVPGALYKAIRRQKSGQAKRKHLGDIRPIT
jgi:hypothetical protein